MRECVLFLSAIGNIAGLQIPCIHRSKYVAEPAISFVLLFHPQSRGVRQHQQTTSDVRAYDVNVNSMCSVVSVVRGNADDCKCIRKFTFVWRLLCEGCRVYIHTLRHVLRIGLTIRYT